MKSRHPDLISALEDSALLARLASSKIALFLDYDGTLTTIVSDPTKALLSTETRKALENLVSVCPVAIVSGRDLKDVKKLVGLNGITYIGCHGLDSDRSSRIVRNRKWSLLLPTLRLAEKRLRVEMKQFAGAFVERKRYAIAIHYRNVSKSNAPKLKRKLKRFMARFPYLREIEGKKVIDLVPNTAWNKGEAVFSLYRSLPKSRNILPVFIGDDATDEDAFLAVRNRGIGIIVGRPIRKTRAKYFLRNPKDVRTFLKRLSLSQIRVRRI